MADHYSRLNTEEACYFDYYARLRQVKAIRTPKQDENARKARDWLNARRKRIYRSTEGGKPLDSKGRPRTRKWGEVHRSDRYIALLPSHLDKATSRRVCQLPTKGSSNQEEARISEREMWKRVRTVDKQTRSWRDGNMAWLRDRRKQVYALGKKNKWPKSYRVRYANLCVASEHGHYYADWKKTHNTTTGAPLAPPVDKRTKCVNNAKKYRGVKESPLGSNRGEPQPSGWMRRVYGSTGIPWCACFTTCMAWDAGVKGSGSAGVAVCVDFARRGTGIYRGWTTDPRRVRKGDHAVIGSTSTHIELVIDDSDACHTIGGNTSGNYNGSQSNGDGCYERHRRRGEIVGWCLVRF